MNAIASCGEKGKPGGPGGLSGGVVGMGGFLIANVRVTPRVGRIGYYRRS
jgi:hypothetical protein